MRVGRTSPSVALRAHPQSPTPAARGDSCGRYTRGVFGGRNELVEVSGAGIQVVPGSPKCRVQGIKVIPNLSTCRVPVSSPYRTNTRTPGIVVEGIYRYRLHTELTEVSSSGIEFVPNLARVCCRVLRPYRTLTQGSVGYLPRDYPRYSLVRTLPNIPSEC